MLNIRFFCVIASASEAINRHRIPRKSARKAMAKPQHSRALKIAIFDSLLLFNLNVPTTAHSGNVRAVGITLTHALWTMTYASATHIDEA